MPSPDPTGMQPQTSPLERLLADRHSCRQFLPDEVPSALVAAVVAAAGRTASWCNTQPWHVTVLSGRRLTSLRHEMHTAAEAGEPATYELGQPTYEGVALERRRAAGWGLYGAVGIQRGDRAASKQQALCNYDFFGAPHLAVVSTLRALGTYGAVDCGAFVGTFLLAAQERGIATIAQAAAVSYPDLVRRHTELAEDRALVCGIAFGFEDPDARANGFRTDRADLDAVMTQLR